MNDETIKSFVEKIPNLKTDSETIKGFVENTPNLQINYRTTNRSVGNMRNHQMHYETITVSQKIYETTPRFACNLRNFERFREQVAEPHEICGTQKGSEQIYRNHFSHRTKNRSARICGTFKVQENTYFFFSVQNHIPHHMPKQLLFFILMVF